MRLRARSRNGDERGKSFFCSQRAHCQDMPISLFYTCDTMILSASGTFFSSVLKCLYFITNGSVLAIGDAKTGKSLLIN